MTIKTPHTKESWEKEYKEIFGYVGSSGTFTGIRDEEIIKWIASKLSQAEQRGREALKTEIREAIEDLHDRTAGGSGGSLKSPPNPSGVGPSFVLSNESEFWKDTSVNQILKKLLSDPLLTPPQEGENNK